MSHSLTCLEQQSPKDLKDQKYTPEAATLPTSRYEKGWVPKQSF